MGKLGCRIEDVSLNYGGNHGVDLVFSKGSRSNKKYAIVEAKPGKGMGALEKDKNGLRQGSHKYNIDRLERYIDSKGEHSDLAENLKNEAYAGNLEILYFMNSSKK